jgi:hypothetical protein
MVVKPTNRMDKAQKAGFEVKISDILGDYVFSEEEKRQMAQELANKNIEIAGLEDEKKAVMSSFKARIDAATANVNLLATHLAQGKKQIFYKCYLDFDRTRKMRLWKEQKTHKVIKEEPMREEDQQVTFAQSTR